MHRSNKICVMNCVTGMYLCIIF